MKKFLAVIILLVLSLVTFVGCHEHTFEENWTSNANQHWHASTCHPDQKGDLANHVWQDSGVLEGNTLYRCSVCGYQHNHVYDTQNWQYNGREHWRPVTCGHNDAPLLAEEHDVDENGVCSICGADTTKLDGYQLAFAYYVVDDEGNPIADENGAYSQVGVTYTSLDKNGSLLVDTTVNTTLQQGDKISFSVKKSVFCYYTDKADAPLVEIISANASGDKTREQIFPDDDGVYTVEIQGDTIVSVANVATSPSTITGAGSQTNPFTINSVVDWLYFAAFINDGSYFERNIGYWKLTTDLDFEGENIYVVGDGFSSANAVFCGNFDGGGHTISNVLLDNSVVTSAGGGYSNYLGLFGVVTGYVGVDAVIANLNVENVTVNATANNNDIVCAGAVLGYGVGANVVNCTVKNSQINVVADDMYMSFAGGVVGYLQSGMTTDGILFYSSVSYSVAENISIKGTGMLYSAGGIVGRVVSYNDQTTSFVYNCYSSGSIADSVRAGGIVGDIQRYSSVQNCYSTATISAHSTIDMATDAQFEGTVLDDRYSYAGGIVGYAENDTVVEGCFFDGQTYATAVAGKNYGKSGNILAGFSAEKYADYYAKPVVQINNASSSQVVTSDYLQSVLKWHNADWSFGEGYPTINQEEVYRTFTVTINVDGQTQDTLQINSQYLPLSYWYILSGSGVENAIPRYYAQSTNCTYGYFFDEQLTKPVPVGYVLMNDVTLYASYGNLSDVAGKYFITNNGISVELELNTDGTYTYQEGAVLLTGTYKFDGSVVTFENSFFSRIASTATATQKANYYTFWAELVEGNLHIYDCDNQYVVSADDENQNSSFTAMARFYEKSHPLVALSKQNVQFSGGYYYTDLTGAKHVFEFNNDNTGSYKKYNSQGVTTDNFTLTDDEQGYVISLDTNGKNFTVISGEDGVLTIDGIELSKIDAFVGSWEKQATSHKTYTFDGMGNWSYEHYVYLVQEGVVNAIKEIVSQSSGSYVVNAQGDAISFVRDGIDVVATIKDGVIFVTENDQPVQVEYVGENSYKGVWYTASNKIVRYTLTLDGLNGRGYGNATLDGFGTVPLQLYYTAVDQNTLYLYVQDVVYAILQYSPKTGIMDGLFYNSTTGAPTTAQTLYLYDDFAGQWVSDIDGLSNIQFNGFGDYDTKDATGNSLAVKGKVTIGSDVVDYCLDRQTGNASFTYKNVSYVLSYNEFTNVITATYGDKVGVIAKADSYANMVLVNQTTSVSFDGRGNFEQGGVVIYNGVSGIYKILENGSVEIQIDSATHTITPTMVENQIVGYKLDGATDLFVDNAFTGEWAVPTENVSIVVGNVSCIPASGVVVIKGSYNGNEVDMYYNGTDTVTFAYGAKKYSLVNTLGGKVSALILMEYKADGTLLAEKIIVKQDKVFGVWKKVGDENTTLTFDGCGDSDYVSRGTVGDMQSNAIFEYERTYKIVDGVVTIYADKNAVSVYATFEECSADTVGAYYNQTSGKYYQLKLK